MICPFWDINLFLEASTSSKYSCDNPSPSEDPMVKKSHFTKYFEISKREIWMFTFIHLNFEWKHSNLRLRLYLLWIKIIDKYKMIAKTLWPLIQVNLPLMFYTNEIPISSQWYKKRLYDFFTLTLQRDVFIKYHAPPLFSVMQHHEKRWDPPTPYVWRNYWTAPQVDLNSHHFSCEPASLPPNQYGLFWQTLLRFLTSEALLKKRNGVVLLVLKSFSASSEAFLKRVFFKK